jgi:hypothetical protein
MRTRKPSMPITKRFWQMGFDATERDIVIPTAFILSHGNMSMVSMEKWCGQKSDRTIFFAKKLEIYLVMSIKFRTFALLNQ